jgi:hypothetical protein
MGRFEIVEGEDYLPDVARTVRSAGRLTRRLNGGKQNRQEESEDREYHEDFDECERAALCESALRVVGRRYFVNCHCRTIDHGPKNLPSCAGANDNVE